jgi:uncharacterized protein (TIGR02466 family)
MIDAHFPTLIYHVPIPTLVDNEALLTLALELEKNVKKTMSWDSNIYTSLGSIDLRANPFICELLTVTRTHVLHFMHHLKIERAREIVCSSVWANVYNKGDYQEIHSHPNHHFSAVYYVKVPENSGSLVFTSPTYLTEAMPPHVAIDSPIEKTVSYTPQENDLFIFQSISPHRVTMNQVDEKRVSIAMNFNILYSG